MTPSRTLFWFCCALITGIFVASLFNMPQIVLWGFLVVAVLSIFFCFLWRYYKYESFRICSTAIFLGFCLLFFMVGILRLQMAEFSVRNSQLRRLNDTEKKVTLVGNIIDEADVRGSFQNLKVKVLDGIVLVRVSRHPKYHYLDQVKLTGKLKSPPMIDGFDYQSYLMNCELRNAKKR